MTLLDSSGCCTIRSRYKRPERNRHINRYLPYKQLDAFGIELSDRIIQLTPLGFQESLYLWKDAALVLTDSGGLQEETTALCIPCLTIRDNTERPVTVEEGTNILAGTKKESILAAYEDFKRSGGKKGRVPQNPLSFSQNLPDHQLLHLPIFPPQRLADLRPPQRLADLRPP